MARAMLTKKIQAHFPSTEIRLVENSELETLPSPHVPLIAIQIYNSDHRARFLGQQFLRPPFVPSPQTKPSCSLAS